MKWYPVTEAELLSLAALQGTSTLAFAAASACAGFYVSVKQSIEFASEVSPKVIGKWQAWEDAAFYAGFLFLVIGLLFLVAGGLSVWNIKRGTKH